LTSPGTWQTAQHRLPCPEGPRLHAHTLSCFSFPHVATALHGGQRPAHAPPQAPVIMAPAWNNGMLRCKGSHCHHDGPTARTARQKELPGLAALCPQADTRVNPTKSDIGLNGADSRQGCNNQSSIKT